MSTSASVGIYQDKDDPHDFTADVERAAMKGKKARPFKDTKKKPSDVNHSNVTPSIDVDAGGVTISHAEQTLVLSIPALRRLRFLRDVNGKALEGKARRDAEQAARVALAALALAAVSYQRSEGFDLRSRCLLVPDGPLALELVPAEGGEATTYSLPREAAAALLREAHDKAAAHGFSWERSPLALQPSPKLAFLIRESRKLSAAGQGDDGEA